jgi:NAD binding domain of 6-phosphogluconate dehydrogenase
MTNKQPQRQYAIGMVGLGIMGRNFLLNMANHGHSVAGNDKDATKVAALRQEAENRDLSALSAAAHQIVGQTPTKCFARARQEYRRPSDSVNPWAGASCWQHAKSRQCRNGPAIVRRRTANGARG